MASDYYFRYLDDFGAQRELYPISSNLVINKDAKANSLEVNVAVNDFVDGNQITFQAGEFITIWAKDEGLIDRSNPLDEDLVGTFKILQIGSDSKDETIKLTCSDVTYDLLSRLYTRVVTGTAPEIIENIVQTINEDGVDQATTPTTIQQLRSDGSAFPTKDFASVYKTAFACISELSQPAMTGDAMPYIFYFSPDGTFHWKYPVKVTVPLEFEYGQEPVITFSHGRDEAVTINFLIYDCGEDKNGVSIQAFELKQDAGTIKGKMSYEPMTDIARDLRFLFEKTGTYTAMTNEEFINNCLEVGKARAETIINRVGRGLRTAKLEVRGDHYNITDLHNVKSETLPLQGLRLDQIIHYFDRNGWRTTLNFKEDVSERNIV